MITKNRQKSASAVLLFYESLFYDGYSQINGGNDGCLFPVTKGEVLL